MGTKFYQACFTRVDTGDLSAGWQVVNPSADIPQSMISFFENQEKANDISVSKQNPDGSPLQVTKIICDQKNIGLVQVQYGLSDNSGRARFFSHGYVADDPYTVLKNPEKILSLSEENFHFRVEETQNMPKELRHTQSFDEKSILNKYKMDRALCVQFIKCALFPLFSSTQTTVFVKTDGSRAMAMELLYLLYRALPYSLRPRVTASTYAKPTGANSMYVFTDDMPAVGSFVDSLTGANNILGGAYEKRLERFPFAVQYAEKMPQTCEAHDAYYTALEDVLRDMGDIHLHKMESLRLAYGTLTSAEIADKEIGGLLYDWLSLPVSANEKVITRIEGLVCAATAKGIELSENVIGLLENCIRQTHAQELYQAYIAYQAQSLIRMGKEAVEKLDTFRKSPTLFQAMYADLCDALQKTHEGKALLYAYYLVKANQLVNTRACTYGNMITFISECTYKGDIQKVRELFCQKCRDILLAEQQKGKDFRKLYGAYQQAIRTIDPGREIQWEEITDAYDRAFRTHFDSNRIREYVVFYQQYDRYPWSDWYPWSGDFLTVWKALDKQEFDVAKKYVKQSCSLGSYKLSPEDTQHFAERILDHALEKDAAANCPDMEFWYAFAGILQMDLIGLMVSKRAAVLCDPGTLDAEIKKDMFWQKRENVERIYEGCKQYCKEVEEQEVLTKTTLRILKDQLTILKQQERETGKGTKDGNPLRSILQQGIDTIQNVGQRFRREKQEVRYPEEDNERTKEPKHK